MLPARIAAEWLQAPATRKVFSALEAVKVGGSRFVGGCVRNTLMGRPVDDVDIATQLLPAQTMAALDAAGITCIPTGLDHGTVTAIVDKAPFEITTLRKDVETDGRHAVVAFSEDWTEDAQRRDFRLNAVYADGEGVLFDPTGEGVADAMAGRVIFIGDADQRLHEDYLRILRFYRFNAWYGAEIDASGQEACKRQAAGLEKIASERIWKELKKLLSAPDPSAAVAAMAEAGILGRVLPGATSEQLLALVAVETAIGLKGDGLQRLMALLVRRPREVALATQHLRLSNAETARLQAWADPALPGTSGLDESAVRRVRYRFGKSILDRALMEAAMASDAGIYENVSSALQGWCMPRFPLNGHHAMSVGLSGPDIGSALKSAENAWIDSDFTLDKTELVTLLRQD